MSGLVVVDGNASQSAGATAHGGLLVVHGDAAARCGISMKGVDIVVGGSVGHLSAFMAQSGCLVVCERRRRRTRRLDLRSAPLCPRRGRRTRRRLRREGAARRARRAGARPARTGRHRRRRSGVVPPLRLGAAALQLPRRPRGRVLMSSADWHLRESALYDRNVIAEIQRAAREGIYDIRGFGAKRRAPALRRPALPRRERLPLPARGLSRAVRHGRHARRRASQGRRSS